MPGWSSVGASSLLEQPIAEVLAGYTCDLTAMPGSSQAPPGAGLGGGSGGVITYGAAEGAYFKRGSDDGGAAASAAAGGEPPLRYTM